MCFFNSYFYDIAIRASYPILTKDISKCLIYSKMIFQLKFKKELVRRDDKTNFSAVTTVLLYVTWYFITFYFLLLVISSRNFNCWCLLCVFFLFLSKLKFCHWWFSWGAKLLSTSNSLSSLFSGFRVSLKHCSCSSLVTLCETNSQNAHILSPNNTNLYVDLLNKMNDYEERKYCSWVNNNIKKRSLE